MWCRAILATTALTCTFSTVQAHGPTQIKGPSPIENIVCVLILNGLQKEDLDVSTLRKLQRHNVNIDDMNNETLRKECETATRHSSTSELTAVNSPELLKKISNASENEEQKNNRSDSSLQNIIINYFNTVQKTSKTNESDKLKNDEPKPSPESPNVENFIKLWNKLNTEIDYAVESTTKAEESATVTIQRTTRSNTRLDSKNMEYITKILENFIATQKITTTISPTTKQLDYDYIAQKIQEILADSNNQNIQKQKNQSNEGEKYVTDRVNEAIEVLHNDSVQYIKLFKMFGPMLDRNANNRNVHFEDKNVSYKSKIRFNDGPTKLVAVPNEKQAYKNMDTETFSEDIIRAISESVKAKVLHDLKYVITTTTKKPRTTTKLTKTTTTLVRPTVASTTPNTKVTEKLEASDVLDKIMEMFQEFKATKETVPTTKTQEENTKTENSAYPPHTIAGNIKHHPVNITSVIMNPFSSIHTPLIQTAILPNQPFTLLNINTPMHNLPDTKPVHKITQLNIFNNKNNYHTSPITIQTNSVEVPPLGLPAQQSFVYQNIVVTTKHPLANVKKDNRHRSYTTHDGKHYGDKTYTAEHKDLYNGFGFGKQERNRDREFINDEYYKETKRKPIKYEDYGRSHYNDHNVERFHEKLERADDWHRITRSRENRNDDDYGTAKLVSRHQLPLNGVKKRSRYDDAHFRSFLKTQQKVNDMLERILATKTAGGPRSVETTV